jgi:hypothetical protein
MLTMLKDTCDRHPGLHPVRLKIDGAGTVHSERRIAFDETLVKELEAVLGPGTVKVG